MPRSSGTQRTSSTSSSWSATSPSGIRTGRRRRSCRSFARCAGTSNGTRRARTRARPTTRSPRAPPARPPAIARLGRGPRWPFGQGEHARRRRRPRRVGTITATSRPRTITPPAENSRRPPAGPFSSEDILRQGVGVVYDQPAPPLGRSRRPAPAPPGSGWRTPARTRPAVPGRPAWPSRARRRWPSRRRPPARRAG